RDNQASHGVCAFSTIAARREHHPVGIEFKGLDCVGSEQAIVSIAPSGPERARYLRREHEPRLRHAPHLASQCTMGAKIEDPILRKATAFRQGPDCAFTRLRPEQNVAVGSLKMPTNLAEHLGGLGQWIPGAKLVTFKSAFARANQRSTSNDGSVLPHRLGALLVVQRGSRLALVIPPPHRGILPPIKQRVANAEVDS